MLVRALLVIATSLMILAAAGCGWKPPAGNQPAAAPPCSPADGPQQATVDTAVAALPGGAGRWRQTAKGNTTDCRLYWVQVASGTAPDAPGQVLFFDHDTPLGAPTPDPRPYVAVVDSGTDAVTVQYQWRQGADQPCCPTGIGTARFTVRDGTLDALDPVPGP